MARGGRGAADEPRAHRLHACERFHVIKTITRMERATGSQLVFNYTSYRTTLKYSQSTTVKTVACSTPIDPSTLGKWRKQLTTAAEDFAALASDLHLLPTVAAIVTDAVIIRRGGDCPRTLPPPSASAGFIRGIHLLHGSAKQRIRWWRPHNVYFGDANATIKPGELWLQHSSLRFDAHPITPASNDASSQWLLFHVWYHHEETSAALRKRPPSKRGQLRTLWEMPLRAQGENIKLDEAAAQLLQSVNRGELSSAALALRRQTIEREYLNAPQPDPCPRHAISSSVARRLWATDSAEDDEEEAAKAMRALIDTAVEEASLLHTGLLHTKPPLTVHTITHWILPPRAHLPPTTTTTTSSNALVRAILVLTPAIRPSAKKDDPGRLRLQLIEPRPAGIRLENSIVPTSAQWPLGMRNNFISPLTPSGTLLVMPSGVMMMSARLNTTNRYAHWIEVLLGPEEEVEGAAATEGKEGTFVAIGAAGEETAAAASGQEDDEPLFEVQPTTTKLHSTPVTVIRRSTNSKAMASVISAYKTVLARSRTLPSSNVSNMGGWQSPPDFMMMDVTVKEEVYPIVYEAIVHHLATTLLSGAATGTSGGKPTKKKARDVLKTLDVRLSGWANANRRHDYNALHEHTDQDWALSGVLYLDDGKDANCPLTFHSPLSTTPTTSDSNPMPPALHLGPPEAGTTLVFPSYLHHSVPPMCGESIRVSIAFNAAVLLPGRVWPDGSSAQPAPGLTKKAIKKVKGAKRVDLWPVALTRARVMPSKRMEESYQSLASAAGRLLQFAIPASDDDGWQTLLQPFIHHALNTTSSKLYVSAYLLPSNGTTSIDTEEASRMLDAHQQQRRGVPLLYGIFYPPSSQQPTDTVCNRTRRRLIIPDPRITAGDVTSHILWRRYIEEGLDTGSAYDVVDGSIFALPSWARAFVYEDVHPAKEEEEEEKCEAKEEVESVRPPLFFHVYR